MPDTRRFARGEILRQAMIVADIRLDGRLPWDLDGARECFADDLDFVGALSMRWHTRLAGRIEREIGEHPMRLEHGVTVAWTGIAEEMPGTRLVLDRAFAEPVDERMATALAKATAKERMLLAGMAGQSTAGDLRGVNVGARIEQQARAAWVVAAPTKQPSSRSLFSRLRAALAA
ncbi:hypothetical protein [Nocardioides acrostichi]|uniref:Uncharacterized protein n=1 Tax=Nocardioides acrostichi TaxID=2784339 RepID=A0A930UYS1_9ACTN|nr:hypothetical protein [Nocardioides acrostichi]MBF4160069.1 hypothetical protein [Nocardioides acrostichi]